MIEALVISLIACVFIAIILAILWASIVRWDLMDRLTVWNFEFWEGFPDGAENTRQLYIRYIKARRSGLPFDEQEFSELSGYMRNDKCRRIWYAFIGLILASSVGIFGGLFLYVYVVVNGSRQ